MSTPVPATAPGSVSASASGSAARHDDTWTRAWHAVGHRVASLHDHPDPVTPDTLPLAVASHAATIRLLVTVHRDLTRPSHDTRSHDTRGDDTRGDRGGGRTDAPTLRQLEADPVRALGLALGRHPADPGVALSDVLTTKPPPGAGRLWHDLARAATVAAHQWRTADPGSRPRAHQAWSLMADVAAIGQGLAVLDTDISRAATRMTAAVQAQLGTAPGVLSDRYAGAATEGLRAAGERTRHLAEQGPLPAVAPLRQPTTRPHILRAPIDVPFAQDATAALLDRADTIAPRDLALLVRVQAALSEHAARLSPDPGLAAAARQHADLLDGTLTRELATVEPLSDQRPLQQARAVLGYVAKLQPTHPHAGRVAAAIARSQPDIVDALHRAARHQLATGAWLVPNPNERHTSAIWVRQAPTATGTQWQPDLVHRLVEARTTAHHLARTAGPNPFPDTAAAIAVATARQGLPPRDAVRPPSFHTTTARPATPARGTDRAADLER
ncbi:hypothetical protein [Aquipuribacter hungaricus]|uniref:hypothetical protein n=1 Tax=Aquipuribacter hungaricus TaxID=545624 RepID=UPI0030EDC9E3